MRRQCRVPKRRPRGDGSRGPRSSSPVPAPRSRCSGPSSTPPKPCGQGSLAALATMCILVASAALAGYAAGLLFDDVRAWALAHAALPLCNLALAPPATTVGAAVMLCAHQAAASRYGGEANETIRFMVPLNAASPRARRSGGPEKAPLRSESPAPLRSESPAGRPNPAPRGVGVGPGDGWASPPPGNARRPVSKRPMSDIYGSAPRAAAAEQRHAAGRLSNSSKERKVCDATTTCPSRPSLPFL